MDFLYDDKIRNEIDAEDHIEGKMRKKMDVIKKLLDITSENHFQDFLKNLHNDCFILGDNVIFQFIIF